MLASVNRESELLDSPEAIALGKDDESSDKSDDKDKAEASS
jgi:hypothetical protein